MINNQFIEISELLKQYPKAAQKLTAWVGDRLRIFQKSLITSMPNSVSDISIPDITEEIMKKSTEITIQSYPATLYTFFDEQDIFIQPHLIAQFQLEKGWGYELTYSIPDDIHNTDEDEAFSSRELAERNAFKKAFKILEERL